MMKIKFKKKKKLHLVFSKAAPLGAIFTFIGMVSIETGMGQWLGAENSAAFLLKEQVRILELETVLSAFTSKENL